MTVQPQKFLFETEFRADPRKEDARRVALEAERAAERDRSYAQGHAEGYAAGEQAALASIEQARLVAFSRIAEAMEHNMASLAAVEARLEAEARETSLAIAEKLAGTLIAREPLARLEALVGDCFANLRQVPHLVIRVHDSLLDDARASVEQMARERGFDGRLVFLAEPTIQPGDCRIEWANGGVILDRDAVMAAIAEVITRHCGPAPAPLPTFDAPTEEAQP